MRKPFGGFFFRTNARPTNRSSGRFPHRRCDLCWAHNALVLIIYVYIKEEPMLPLHGKVVLVTGASRGIGKGVAHALGAAGATVYVTGRTDHPTNATVPLPGTIHETAALVTQAGGVGIALRCDHQDDAQVHSVFEHIHAAHGHLDLLVNNAWAGYQAKQRSKKNGFHTPFWKLAPTFWDTMFTVGVRSHYVASVGRFAYSNEYKSALSPKRRGRANL